MIPGMNPKQMAKMMKQMGVQQTDIEGVQRVEIVLADRKFVFEPAQVSQVNMMGQLTYQVVGDPKEVSLDTTPEISDEDIKTVMDQTKCSEETAREALEGTKGDLAEAIMNLQ